MTFGSKIAEQSVKKVSTSNTPFFQAKLRLNKPGDAYEQEADAVANKVMRMSDTETLQTKPSPINIQRKCAACEEEEKVQMKGETNAGGGMTAPASVNNVINSPGQKLDTGTRSFMESRFGYDFGNVQVHNDSLAHQSSSEINALAYTHGNHVVFGAGQYQPNTNSGKQLMAHELTHVIQQGTEGLFVQRACGVKMIKGIKGCVGLGSDLEEYGSRSDDIYKFKISCDEFLPGEESRLRDVASAIDATKIIDIHGFASEEGPEKFNEDLSCARALAAEQILYEEGVSYSQIRSIYMHGPKKGLREDHRSVVLDITSEQKPVIHCGPDSTSWLITEMNDNAKDPFIKACADADLEMMIPGWGWGVQAACLEGFKDHVKAGAIWDYKSNQNQWHNRPHHKCPSKECDKTVTLCGHCLNYDVPGNIHYGWIGRVIGYRPWVLHKGAARAQKGGVDDPRDTVAINIGINMADNKAGLCDEINSKINQLNLDGTTGCEQCGWSNMSKKDIIP